MKSVRLAQLFGVLAVIAACATTAGPARDRGKAAAVANMNLGAGYLQQGRADLAVERLERALKQDPRLADAHSIIALAYDQLGMTDEAEQHYRRATQLAPDNAATTNSYAVFLCLHNRWSDAEPLFKRAAENRRVHHAGGPADECGGMRAQSRLDRRSHRILPATRSCAIRRSATRWPT